jgi:membrane-associated PAP2 superfamily phosphatase
VLIPPTPSGKSAEIWISRDNLEKFQTVAQATREHPDAFTTVLWTGRPTLECVRLYDPSALDELVSALEYYADSENYEYNHTNCIENVMHDAGDIARQAIARFKTPLPEGGGK